MPTPIIKVMFLADTYANPYAGTEGQLRMLIEGLDRSRFIPSMAVFRSSEYIEKNGFFCPIEVLNVGSMASFASLRKLCVFARRIKHDGFSIVHIFFNDASIIAPVFLKLFGLKVIISRRDMGYWYTPAILALLKINRCFVDHAVVNSQAVKKITAACERIDADKISVIYNGYENNEVPIQEKAVADLFVKSGITGEHKVIGLVANIRSIKRIDDVIHAMPKILAGIPNARFVLVGAGDNSGLTALAKELKVSHAVWFAGHQSEPKAFMRRFDVAVLCSESEGFSNAIVEYMKCHNPVVCSNVGGNSEIVVDGETGYLIQMGNVNALAEKVTAILSDPNLAKTLADNGYDLAQKEYSKEKMLAEHYALYNHLLETVS